jgi:hypothetical protein
MLLKTPLFPTHELEPTLITISVRCVQFAHNA